MKTRGSLFLMLAFLVLLTWNPVQAQSEDELQLSMSRDWGYGGMGEIQGLFSMIVKGPDDLSRVVFMIDNESIGEDTEAPFRIQFTTDDYPPGTRTISASGYTIDGRELTSNQVTVNFVSADKANQMMTRILIPVIGLVVLAILAGTIGPLLMRRRRSQLPYGQPRKYGIKGGAICPKCNRPFPLPFFGLNLGVGMLTVCPHCGKWGFMRSRSLSELRSAEVAELEQAQVGAQVLDESEEEKLRKALDDSRYQGS